MVTRRILGRRPEGLGFDEGSIGFEDPGAVPSGSAFIPSAPPAQPARPPRQRQQAAPARTTGTPGGGGISRPQTTTQTPRAPRQPQRNVNVTHFGTTPNPSSLTGGGIQMFQTPNTGDNFLGDWSSHFDYPHPSQPGVTVRGRLFMQGIGLTRPGGGGTEQPPPGQPPPHTPETPPSTPPSPGPGTPSGGGSGSPFDGFQPDRNPFPPNSAIGPVIDVGEDPLSRLIDDSLFRLIENEGRIDSPLLDTTEQALQDIINARGGVGGLEDEIIENRGNIGSLDQEFIENRGALFDNPQELAMRLETARGPLDRLRRAQLSESQAALADRGQLSLSEPTLGPAAASLGRIEEGIAPFFAEAGQRIAINELERQEDRLQNALGRQFQRLEGALGRRDARLQNALGLATGMSIQQSQALLGALGTATERQQVLSNIALGVLDRNIAWNQFLAQLGLERDQVMNQIRQGNLAAMLPILNSFIQSAGVAAGGFVG